MSMPTRRWPCRHAALLWALAVPPAGCTSSPTSDEATPAEEAAPAQAGPGTLRIALPAGVSVSIGGEDRGRSPSTLELPAGEHPVVLRTHCQRVERTVTITAGQTTIIDADPELAFATLKLRVTSHDGAELQPSLMLDDTKVPLAPELRVPACVVDLRVAAEGRGAYREQIDLTQASTLEREIVLAPGPDVVRIHGGDFVLGPTMAQVGEWTDADGELMYPRIPVKVDDFELDRTEVTVAQWRACRAAAEPKFCRSDEECAAAVGCPRHVHHRTHLPHDSRRPFCNAEIVPLDRPAVEGRNDHPMNCVARWSAEDYCRWVGKHLPTSVQWECAARNGDATQGFPWGNDAPTCERGTIALRPECPAVKGTTAVCSKPEGSNAQGICDLYGNVTEYTLPDELGHADRDATDHTCKGPSWEGSFQTVFEGTHCYGDDYYKKSDVGFRCARSINEEQSAR